MKKTYEIDLALFIAILQKGTVICVVGGKPFHCCEGLPEQYKVTRKEIDNDIFYFEIEADDLPPEIIYHVGNGTLCRHDKGH